MSFSFSANQYEGTFRAQRLQNWCQAKPFKERPNAKQGHSKFVANDRGHLLPGVKRGSSWPDFKGTWDLPARIPAQSINPTGRSDEGLRRLRAWGIDPNNSQPQRVHTKAKAEADQQVSSTLTEDCPAAQGMGLDRPNSQDQTPLTRPDLDDEEAHRVAEVRPATRERSSCQSALKAPVLTSKKQTELV